MEVQKGNSLFLKTCNIIIVTASASCHLEIITHTASSVGSTKNLSLGIFGCFLNYQFNSKLMIYQCCTKNIKGFRKLKQIVLVLNHSILGWEKQQSTIYLVSIRMEKWLDHSYLNILDYYSENISTHFSPWGGVCFLVQGFGRFGQWTTCGRDSWRGLPNAFQLGLVLLLFAIPHAEEAWAASGPRRGDRWSKLSSN